MAIENHDGNIVITGEADTRLYQIMALAKMLEMEVKHPGMGFSKGSPFAMLKRLGIIPKNIQTKKKGLEIAEKYLDAEKTRRKNNAFE